MKNILDGIIGVTGIVLTGITMENLTAWVSLICSLVITATTCGIQVYRMIRDRDKDIKKSNDENEEKSENEESEEK